MDCLSALHGGRLTSPVRSGLSGSKAILKLRALDCPCDDNSESEFSLDFILDGLDRLRNG